MSKKKPFSASSRPIFEPKMEAQKNFALPAFLENTWLTSGLIFSLAFLLYANTLFHDFTVDDAIVITDNMFTTKGVSGISGILTEDTFFGFFKERGKEALVSGGRYRPMTLVIFAFLWEMSQKPFIFHLFTVVLFGLTCVVLHRTLLVALENRGEKLAKIVAFGAAALFAAHPIHTEAVANIKGCDEILTLCLSLAALLFALKRAKSGLVSQSLAGAAIFFFALLSKENAITFVAVIPLALWFFTDLGFGKSVSKSLSFLAAAVVFMMIRTSILGFKFGAEPLEMMNNPFVKVVGTNWVKFSFAERAATILFTLGKYIQLLFAPIDLTHDYYPRHIDIMFFGNWKVLASILVYVGLIYLAIKNWTKKSIISFSILFFLLTLSIVSNIVFPVGTNMGERFAFMPSVGFCLALAALFYYFINDEKGKLRWSTPTVAFSVVLLLFSVRTIIRNPAWETNTKLFLTDIKVSKNSAKLCNAVGGTLVDESLKEKDEVKRVSMLNEASVSLNNAIKLHPTYKNAFLLLGNCNNYLKKYDESITAYRQALKIDPDYKEAKSNLAITLREAGKLAGERDGNAQKALGLLNESFALAPTDFETMRLLGVANGILGNHQKAVEFFEKSVAAQPENASAIYDLGTALIYAGNQKRGLAEQARALEKDPKILENRGKK